MTRIMRMIAGILNGFLEKRYSAQVIYLERGDGERGGRRGTQMTRIGGMRGIGF